MNKPMLIGNPEKLAIEIGPGSNDGVRTIDVIAGGIILTCDDNAAFVPQLMSSLALDVACLASRSYIRFASRLPKGSVEDKHEFLATLTDTTQKVEFINSDEMFSSFRFLDWGPTTDNLISFLVENQGELFLTYCFWRPEHHDRNKIGQVQKARIDADEASAVLKRAMDELQRGAA